MTLDLRTFFKATEPSRTLIVNNPEDQKYYIDFSSVRGGDIVNKIKNKITFFKPNEPTCSLFTGHIGCGKSTELLRLKTELEQENFHVVYFESSEDLEMNDVDIVDVLLVIALQVSKSLEDNQINLHAKGFRGLLESLAQTLKLDLNSLKLKLPVIGDVSASKKDGEFSLSFGIGEITAMAKSDSKLREQLNQYLGPRKTQLLNKINEELIEPAIVQLTENHGKTGLVVIVDNLDRIYNSPKSWGRPQQEYLFVDQGEYLTKFNCHLVYTMPLALKFSNDYGILSQRFFEEPKVLPMVPVKLKDGNKHEKGVSFLRQMVLARAFPEITEQKRLNKVTEIFDGLESLDRLCHMSGGHVRDLLRLLNEWIMDEMKLPLSRKSLENLISARRAEMIMRISVDEWELIRQVSLQKKVSDDLGYQNLIRSQFVFEYRDQDNFWFDINPILADVRELQS